MNLRLSFLSFGLVILVGVTGVFSACGSAKNECEKARDRMLAKYEECGIEPSEEEEDDEEVECSEEEAERAHCIADCTENASCSQLTSSDLTTTLEVIKCAFNC